MPKVSICIAVYNVEKYIEQCVRSLFEQTLDDLEYVFVDDASPDSSIDIMLRILEEYPHRKEQVKLIRHENNQGVAAARKDAIAAATGDYIIHCDPDDWVELNMYEKMYNKAVENNADIVVCDVSDEKMNPFSRDSDYIKSQGDLVAGLLTDQMIYCSLFNKLYKAAIVKNKAIQYDERLRSAEDWCSSIQYFMRCHKCEAISEFFYHYRTSNWNSLTKKDNLLHNIHAIEFADDILKNTKYTHLLDIHKVRTLILAIPSDAVSAQKWHSLWKDTKLKFLFMKYPIKFKLIFYLACINYPFAHWFWKKIARAKEGYSMNKKILVYSCGDSHDISTWSNVPFLFCRSLEKQGFKLIRVNIEPLPWLNKIFNTISFKFFFKILKRKACPVFARSRLRAFLTRCKIFKASLCHKDACLHLFLGYSFISRLKGVKNVLWCDWSDEIYIERLGRKPEFYELFWHKAERKAISAADVVYSLFPVCAKDMACRYSREVVYLQRNVVNTIDEKKFDLTDNCIVRHFSSAKILFVGNCNYRDAALKLIETFSDLSKNVPNLELHIIGMTSTQLGVADQRIICHGYLKKDNLEQSRKYYELLESAFVIVNPAAQWGAFSSIVEAMYYGVPVIISPYDDFVASFGKSIDFGYYIDAQHSLLECLQNILAASFEDYKLLSYASHNKVADWTWDNYVHIFCEDLKKRGLLI